MEQQIKMRVCPRPSRHSMPGMVICHPVCCLMVHGLSISERKGLALSGTEQLNLVRVVCCPFCKSAMYTHGKTPGGGYEHLVVLVNIPLRQKLTWNCVATAVVHC